MPSRYARKRRSPASKLPYGAYKIAESLGRKMRFDKRVEEINKAAELLGGAGVQALGNANVARTRAIASGRGAYSLGKQFRKFKQGAIGSTLKGMALDNIRTMGGTGMYTGMGEYEAEANDLLSTKSTMDVVPAFSEESDDGVIYSRREYVSEIYGPPFIAGSTTTAQPFVLQSFAINPGLEKAFPWLSQVAANYDEFEMIQLCFTFKSTTTESGNQVNGQVGTVIMATNYNAAAAPFAEKFTMMQYSSANSGRLTESLQHFVECDPTKLSGSSGHYIRTNPVIANQDLKTYDHGLFQIAIANCTSNLVNQSIGELWVSYTVRLRKPRFYTGKGLSISKDIFLSYPSGTELPSLLMGTYPLKGQQNNIGCLLGSVAPNLITITIPASYAGFLRVTASLDATNIFMDDVTVFSATGNISFVNDLYGPTVNAALPVPVNDTPVGQICNTTSTSGVTLAATSGFIAICHISVQIATNGVNNVLTIDLPTGTVINQTYIEIGEFNSGFSYKANSLSQSEAPIWIDNSGIVIVP